MTKSDIAISIMFAFFLFLGIYLGFTATRLDLERKGRN
jgi:hypothetical protein